MIINHNMRSLLIFPHMLLKMFVVCAENTRPEILRGSQRRRDMLIQQQTNHSAAPCFLCITNRFRGRPGFSPKRANSRAHAKSRALRLGKSSAISCSGTPFRNSDATCWRGMRVPRKTGSPPRTSDEETTRRLPQRYAAKFLATVCRNNLHSTNICISPERYTRSAPFRNQCDAVLFPRAKTCANDCLSCLLKGKGNSVSTFTYRTSPAEN